MKKKEVNKINGTNKDEDMEIHESILDLNSFDYEDHMGEFVSK